MTNGMMNEGVMEAIALFRKVRVWIGIAWGRTDHTEYIEQVPFLYMHLSLSNQSYTNVLCYAIASTAPKIHIVQLLNQAA